MKKKKKKTQDPIKTWASMYNSGASIRGRGMNPPEEFTPIDPVPIFDKLVEIAKQTGSPAVLIGGIAIGAYGVVRHTNDVDIVASPAILDGLPGNVVSKIAHSPWTVASTTIDGIAVDCLLTVDKAGFFDHLVFNSVVWGGRRCATLIDLMILKAVAGRPRDEQDFLGLLFKNPAIVEDKEAQKNAKKWLKKFGGEGLDRWNDWFLAHKYGAKGWYD